VRALHGHTAGLQDVAWSRDGAMLLTAADDGTARVFELAGAAA
jgi:WD40 repeat protein